MVGKKFNVLARVLTLRGASHKLEGNIYNSCVRSAMVYGSETRPMKKENLNWLEKTEHTMMRRMCGVTLRERVLSKELYSRLGMDSIPPTVTRSRLRCMDMCRERTIWTGLNVVLNMK